MSPLRKSVLVLTLFVTASVVFGLAPTALAREDQSVEEKVAQLEQRVAELEERIPRIGYINRGEAFSVFPGSVEEERRKVNQLEEEMKDLQARARKGEISESEFKRERDLMRAKHLQARINVDLAILDTMIGAKGFSEITTRLEELKSQTKPMRKTIDNLISDIKDYAVSPKQVSEMLNRVEQEQFKQLDDILTNIAQTKITQTAQQVAQENDYDLVIERQNVITYRKEAGVIDDLTGKVRERLKVELRPE